MRPQVTQKISCRCNRQGCKETKQLFPSTAKTFKYCSNECKWLVKKRKIPHNKLAPFRHIQVQCNNALCKNTKILLPCNARRFKYCSHRCSSIVRTKQFQTMVDQQQQRDGQQLKKRIWFV